eukprot:CAMPEP_0181223652 /NCGR_PEP_ID=MMETSP1096-20121128/30667_1 /TAXON_ID=156174 ORGANISM="Chrysochromulina ericina, Strain CCMP281" /NCGR_SAMPLE_ID=MMETSP1096 /ASSEMBLY_ACC=CAM_ASM_000453 /LENGTH=65 /DNA_ID=CAMNT_0023316601 /DNA_START=47 /DNA_END=241 /DNA_ORIENTATION=+
MQQRRRGAQPRGTGMEWGGYREQVENRVVANIWAFHAVRLDGMVFSVRRMPCVAGQGSSLSCGDK